MSKGKKPITFDLETSLGNNIVSSMNAINSLYPARFDYFSKAPANYHPFLVDSEFFRQEETNLIRDGECAIRLEGDFILNEEVSASKAIKSLFTNGKHFLECASSLELARYEAIRRTLVNCLGEDNGNKSFDKIFGSEEEITPKARRLNISPNPTISTHPRAAKTSEGPRLVNPLFMFVDFIPQLLSKKIPDISTLKNISPIGAAMYFKGHPGYKEKHTYSHSQGWNVIKTGSDQYIGFGLAKKISALLSPLKGKDICEVLTVRYNQKPIASIDSSSEDNIQCKQSDIPGFIAGSITYINPEKLRSYITTPDIFLGEMDHFLARTQDELNKAYEKLGYVSLYRDAIKTTQSTKESNQSPSAEEELEYVFIDANATKTTQLSAESNNSSSAKAELELDYVFIEKDKTEAMKSARENNQSPSAVEKYNAGRGISQNLINVSDPSATSYTDQYLQEKVDKQRHAV